MSDSLATTHDPRYAQLINWLTSLQDTHKLDLNSLQPASSDASFRRYFRIHSGETTLVVMDAPPPQENIASFLQITQRLQDAQLQVPEIKAADAEQGFILMSDLGKDNFYHALQGQLNQTDIDQLYRRTLEVLVKVQTANTEGLAVYDQEKLLEELQVFPEWYLDKYAQIQLSPSEMQQLLACFDTLTHYNAQEAKVMVLRDFHSPNLMLPLPGQSEPSLIDYQDAVLGPISYDVASLVMDARHTWDEAQQLDWAIRYWQAAFAAGLNVPDDFAVFHQQYEWMSLQRNLRILGVFARLSLRDNKHHYLDHIPRLLAYARQVASRYQSLSPILKVLDKIEGRQTVLGITL